MYETKAYVRSPRGLHARPSAAVTREAQKYASDIVFLLEKADKTANAKSVLQVLTLAALKGDCIRITAEGVDEVEAGKNVAKIINEFHIPEEE